MCNTIFDYTDGTHFDYCQIGLFILYPTAFNVSREKLYSNILYFDLLIFDFFFFHQLFINIIMAYVYSKKSFFRIFDLKI